MGALHSLGILGGSFNPPHRGHLAVARHALSELGLERVALMPVHTPPHRTPGVDPGPLHRLRMCELAAGEVSGLAACGLEVERGGASYTVDTLRSIHATHADVRLTLIMGADTARTLGSWREPAELLALAELAVAMRRGTAHADVQETVTSIVGGRGQAPVSFLQMEITDVSSSMVRERVARAEPIEELVGPGVAGYIAEHGLYRLPVEVAS